MNTIKLPIDKPLVSADWLYENLNAENLVVIDATLKKVTWEKNDFENENIQIEKARYLDIKNVFSDTSTSLPNMMLSEEKFQEQARLLGINSNSAIVVYDAIGIYTSPRVWWMFKAMGHHNIAVLDGGLPEWIRKNLPTERTKNQKITKGDFIANYTTSFFQDNKDVFSAIVDDTTMIVDARSNDRFLGLADEPREGLRAGHIPSSINLPYSELQIDGKMLNKEQLSLFFNELYTDKEKVIFSCGSGITACILALGAEISGVQNLTVYDGSWTDWGGNYDLPIQKK